jgi:hypothetical protein
MRLDRLFAVSLIGGLFVPACAAPTNAEGEAEVGSVASANDDDVEQARLGHCQAGSARGWLLCTTCDAHGRNCKDYVCTADMNTCEALADSPKVEVWASRFAVRAPVKTAGDFNGDGRADIIAFHKTSPAPERGDVTVALSNGVDAFTNPSVWHPSFCAGTDKCTVGDFDGDGKTDIVQLAASGDIRVALSLGTRFGAANVWFPAFAPSTYELASGDVNGDGKDDVLAIAKGGSGKVLVGLSNGSALSAPAQWDPSFCAKGCEVGDVSGDGKADLVVFGDESIKVERSTGYRFGHINTLPTLAYAGAVANKLADVDGDGLLDYVTMRHDAQVLYAPAISSLWNTPIPVPGLACRSSVGCEIADATGDGILDSISLLDNGTSGDVIVRRGE